MGFKVGDKVRVKDTALFNQGYIGTVSNVNHNYVYPVEVCFDDIGEVLATFTKAELSLLEERDSENTPVKHDQGKPRMDLIRPEFTLELGKALAYGADKYNEKHGEIPNYLKGGGFNYSKILASLERHIAQWKGGENTDEESGLSHLAHAAVNVMFLLTYELTDKGVDDRVKLEKK